MEILALLSFVLAATSAIGSLELIDRDLDDRWTHFKETFKKEYVDANHESRRRLAWQDNLKIITEHNRKADLGLHSYRMGVNKWSDLTFEEFSDGFLGFKRPASENVAERLKRSNRTLPKTLDWRTKGHLTPIRDQQNCGSCWSFAAAGAIESQIFRKTGELIWLSVQQLMDCSYYEGNLGCDGGRQELAFESVIRMGGIMKEADYKYAGRDDVGWGVRRLCVFNPKKVFAHLSGYQLVDSNEDALQEAVATVGPIVIDLAATPAFVSYSSGIFDGGNCDRIKNNHAVLVVGYGEEDGQEFWIIRSSWGPFWGENGYMRLRRNANNLCGLANHAFYPIIFGKPNIF